MSRFTRERLDPMELLKAWPEAWDALSAWWKDAEPHIMCDPKLRRGDYYIVRGVASDGTWAFRTEAIKDVLRPLVLQESYLKPDEPDWSRVRQIRYTVGMLRVVTVYGPVDLPCGRVEGQRQRFRLPVRAEYVY